MNRLLRRLLWRPEPGDARVLVGCCWFLIQMAALWWSVFATAVLFGAMAALAGWQTIATWMPKSKPFVGVVAATVAAAMPLAAARGSRELGLVVLAGLIGSAGLAVASTDDRAGRMATLGWVVQAWFPVGLGAGCVVLTAAYELGAAVILLWMIAVFDAGEYLIGVESRARFAGIVAGLVGTLAVAAMVVELGIPPLDRTSVWRFAGLALIALPLGPMLGSLLLPTPRSSAPALRRLDATLVMAPAWAWTIGLVLQGLPGRAL